MEEIELVKKFSFWKEVLCLNTDDLSIYFESPFGEISELSGIKYLYTSKGSEYLIAVADNSYYIAFWFDDKTVYCFGKCKSLKDACENL